MEGWFGVYHADATLNLPYYRMSTEPGDDASVKIEKAGHYCIAFVGGLDDGGDDGELLPIVYDGDRVFGASTTLQEPNGVILNGIDGIVRGRQYGDAKTSSAFAALRGARLGPGESVTVTSFYGKADDISELTVIAAKVKNELLFSFYSDWSSMCF